MPPTIAPAHPNTIPPITAFASAVNQFEFSLSCHVKPYATRPEGKRIRHNFEILITLRQPDRVIKGDEIGGFQVLELCESRQGCMKSYNRDDLAFQRFLVASVYRYFS